MKKLKVDLDEIAFVMEQADDLGIHTSLFDGETGEVVTLPNELIDAVESGDEEEIEDLPEWELEMIDTAKSVLADEGGRFVEIPRRSSRKGYNLMVEFAESVANKHLREKLSVALDGKGAFGRFKSVLGDYPDELEWWYAFNGRAMRQEVVDWLHSIGIEPELSD